MMSIAFMPRIYLYSITLPAGVRCVGYTILWPSHIDEGTVNPAMLGLATTLHWLGGGRAGGAPPV